MFCHGWCVTYGRVTGVSAIACYGCRGCSSQTAVKAGLGQLQVQYTVLIETPAVGKGSLRKLTPILWRFASGKTSSTPPNDQQLEGTFITLRNNEPTFRITLSISRQVIPKMCKVVSEGLDYCPVQTSW